MKPWPAHDFELRSPLSPEQAVQAFGRHVGPVSRVRIAGKGRDQFQGEVTHDGFSVTRILGYRNIFQPFSDATIAADEAGSRIRVRMRPRLGGLPVALGLASLILIVSTPALGGLQIAALFTLILYALCMTGFWIEAGHQERVMRAILRAR